MVIYRFMRLETLYTIENHYIPFPLFLLILNLRFLVMPTVVFVRKMFVKQTHH